MGKHRQPISSIKSLCACAVVVACISIFNSIAKAYFEGNRRYDGQTIVNGVDFKLYKSFPQKWQFVTSGFADESAKLTVVYANLPAYAHLQKIKKGEASAFPDGAAFGRVLFATEKDPRIEDARRPTAKREYQLMVRGSSKYKSTDGWGFARFNENGSSFNEEPGASATSCLACHSLARKNDFVFSKLAEFVPNALEPAPKAAPTH